jgi:hypothetical protein
MIILETEIIKLCLFCSNDNAHCKDAALQRAQWKLEDRALQLQHDAGQVIF